MGYCLRFAVQNSVVEPDDRAQKHSTGLLVFEHSAIFVFVDWHPPIRREANSTNVAQI